MKVIRVRYNLENTLWTDDEYENQEDQFISIPEWYLKDYIKQERRLKDNESVDIISNIELKEI